ncbi:MAG TPA: patatin-like phospholipase family protein [Acidocella sp.]|nr:patatin-like phospholipase family protein [Acidocella sp.]
MSSVHASPASRRRLLAGIAATSLVSGCAALSRMPAVPSAPSCDVTVLGLRDIRYWGDEASAQFVQEGGESYQREIAYRNAQGSTGPLPEADFLAISGGGEDGAYGAGLLVGWSAAGTRPVFKLVTGISTGALTAPFAFLGSAYDPQLTQVYTAITAKDVLRERDVFAILTNDAVADNSPLRKTVSRFIDQTFLNAIAAEYNKGRLLFIGTTNLDAGRPVIWNIGKIAASGAPGASKLIEDILLASSAIPGAFPPTMITVECNGVAHQEMHVDGGASAQVFAYPPAFNLRLLGQAQGITRIRKLYVIRNARLDPDWLQVRRQTLSIAKRAISTLIQSQGIGDLYRMYAVALRDGVDFNLANIPSTFTQTLSVPFDKTYMNALFRVGYDAAKGGYPWSKLPPGFNAIEQESAPSAPVT